jgi:transposase-like protein
MSEKIVQLNEEAIKGQLKELVRGRVEETLNELLEKEADQLTQAARFKRNEVCQGCRSGRYGLKPHKYQRRRQAAHSESERRDLLDRRHRALPRRKSSVEETLAEMYFVGISVRRVEGVIATKQGAGVCSLHSPSGKD